MSWTCSISGQDSPRVLASSPTTKNVDHLIVHAFEKFMSSGQFSKGEDHRAIANSGLFPGQHDKSSTC